MTPENFVYWLQGYLELTEPLDNNDMSLLPEQIKVIKEHVALVFKKETVKHVILKHDSPNKNNDIFCDFKSNASC